MQLSEGTASASSTCLIGKASSESQRAHQVTGRARVAGITSSSHPAMGDEDDGYRSSAENSPNCGRASQKSSSIELSSGHLVDTERTLRETSIASSGSISREDLAASALSGYSVGLLAGHCRFGEKSTGGASTVLAHRDGLCGVGAHSNGNENADAILAMDSKYRQGLSGEWQRGISNYIKERVASSMQQVRDARSDERRLSELLRCGSDVAMSISESGLAELSADDHPLPHDDPMSMTLSYELPPDVGSKEMDGKSMSSGSHELEMGLEQIDKPARKDTFSNDDSGYRMCARSKLMRQIVEDGSCPCPFSKRRWTTVLRRSTVAANGLFGTSNMNSAISLHGDITRQPSMPNSSIGGHHLAFQHNGVFLKESCSRREERFYEMVRPVQLYLQRLADLSAELHPSGRENEVGAGSLENDDIRWQHGIEEEIAPPASLVGSPGSSVSGHVADCHKNSDSDNCSKSCLKSVVSGCSFHQCLGHRSNIAVRERDVVYNEDVAQMKNATTTDGSGSVSCRGHGVHDNTEDVVKDAESDTIDKVASGVCAERLCTTPRSVLNVADSLSLVPGIEHWPFLLELAPFVPRYHGLYRVRVGPNGEIDGPWRDIRGNTKKLATLDYSVVGNEVSDAAVVSREEGVTCLSSLRELNDDNSATTVGVVRQMIVLEDICRGFKHPCVLDIKMGRRQYGLNPSEAKLRSKEQKAAISTTMKYGIRLAGMRRWCPDKQQYETRSKISCRSMSLEELRDTVLRFMQRSSKIKHGFYQQIRQLRQAFTKDHVFRFFTSSLLLVYDADCPLVSQRVVMVDFAFTYERGELVRGGDPDAKEDRDVGYIMALDTILGILS
uniref:Kinase n=1 Tax=Trypanosoma vivax (strain Y486) TaxID=1055687 RepID=G0TYR3_TRYVY|nr:putative inositol polyphosphate kinase-like protein [Trypanosoma vivax Y486]